MLFNDANSKVTSMSVLFDWKLKR